MKIISIKKAFSITKVEKNYSTKSVKEIINQVKLHGNFALRKFEKKFNGVDIKNLQVTKKEISEAYKFVSKDQINAINMAKDRLVKTETALKKQLKQIKITESGTKITKSFVPLGSVGCYVPGGLAKYPSSAIISVVPAKLARCDRLDPAGHRGTGLHARVDRLRRGGGRCAGNDGPIPRLRRPSPRAAPGPAGRPGRSRGA